VLSRVDLDRVYRGVIALADIQKTVCDDDLLLVVARVRQDADVDAAALADQAVRVEQGYGHGI